MEKATQAEQVYSALLNAGELLLEAMAEERRAAERYPEDISKVFGYLEVVSAARKKVDERADEYCSMLAECGFPDLPIRHAIECGESDLRKRFANRTMFPSGAG